MADLCGSMAGQLSECYAAAAAALPARLAEVEGRVQATAQTCADAVKVRGLVVCFVNFRRCRSGGCGGAALLPIRLLIETAFIVQPTAQPHETDAPMKTGCRSSPSSTPTSARCCRTWGPASWRWSAASLSWRSARRGGGRPAWRPLLPPRGRRAGWPAACRSDDLGFGRRRRRRQRAGQGRASDYLHSDVA
jgi:hypothetical protein